MADSSSMKRLYEQYCIPQFVVKTYFRAECSFVHDTITQKLEQLQRAFTTYGIKGNTLIGLCIAPTIHQYIAACDYFKEIIATTYTESCLEELQKWLKNDRGAYDWTSLLKYACELEGDRNKWMEKEEKVRRTVTQTLTYDIGQRNPLAPHALPQADCLLLEFCLEFLCSDKKKFSTGVENAACLLRTGGYLIMMGVIENTFYMVGSKRFPTLCIEKTYLKETLTEKGFVMKQLEVLPRTEKLMDSMADAKYFYFIVACKEKDVE
ncbi:nicotinamide N-methyltransferase-like [Ambystoma mexicanum]|uniref:nicotinamide N-methyltransferase-like n=1 Tax=Ambystoma mexicanum TaxID=8296 RepID=UPI0037E81DBE